MKYILIAILALTFTSCWDAVDTAQREFKPSALLKKYEWFKDMSAAIDKKRADIEVYKEQIKEETDPAEKAQLRAEMRGLISSHNELCAEYNAAMTKFNYRFTNVGDLPQGATEPLPREVKPYLITSK